MIIAAGLLFALEFIADKFPSSISSGTCCTHSSASPSPLFLACGATQNLSLAAQILATLLAGAIALAAHARKTAVRTASLLLPCPSNMALSAGDDLASISLRWFATQYPTSQ